MTTNFWNKEYAQAKYLKLSDEPAEDLLTFMRWAERNSEWYPFPKGGIAVDLGCGNGRNIKWLCENTGMKGIGIDSSNAAILLAKKNLKEKKDLVNYITSSIAGTLPIETGSVDVVLDMMTSHFLSGKEREVMLNEVVRILKPYGWFFMKTFVLDGDSHAKRLLRDFPGTDPHTYIHPKIKVPEFVTTELDLYQSLSPHFKVHKMLKSYKHVTKAGKPHKRRTISAYLERLA